MQLRNLLLSSLYGFFILSGILPSVLHAQQNTSELQNKIRNHEDTIEDITLEIQSYQKQLEGISKEANTLLNTIKSLDITKKKLEADVRLTEKKIAEATASLGKLTKDIGNREERIEESRRLVGETLKKVYQEESGTFTERVLGGYTLAEVSIGIESLNRLQSTLVDTIGEIEVDKKNLEINAEKVKKTRADLQNLNTDLKNQKAIIEDSVKEKNTLLTVTKNQESNYKALIANKVLEREKFERELFEFESALKLSVDVNSFPSPRPGTIGWPLDKVIITQYFGNTAFATKNPQIYNGKGHTGIDLGTPVGTPIRSAQVGTVVGIGNTDLIYGCASYGKWIFVKHPNGLSTLYAHLSLISSSVGDTVSKGDIIGYSGNTGYSTGPHLHFGVYASQGVKIASFNNSVNCKGAIIPLADPKAYLNPLSYL